MPSAYCLPVTRQSSHCNYVSLSSRALFWVIILAASASSAFASGVTLKPTKLSFGNQIDGIPTAPMTTTLTNGETTALTITSITTTLSDFTQTNNCPMSPSTLAPGASCTISVVFTPGATGLRQGKLEVNDNASGSPQTVQLSGHGISATLKSIAVTPSSATLAVGATQQFTATGTYSNGDTENLTNLAAWSSTVTTVATINSTGLATAVSAGTTTIEATYSGVTGSASLTVTSSVSAPTGLVATAGNAQVALSWNASSGAISYSVSRSTVSGGPYTQIATVTGTSYTDTTVTNNTTYYYVVSVTTAGGTSPNSAQVSATPEFTPGFANIQHIVFLVHENRTFDNYFGTYPGGDGTTTATLSTGQVFTLNHEADFVGRDIHHSFYAEVLGTDYGKVDKFDLISGCNVNGDYLCLSQLYQQDIPNYWSYAGKFVLADHMFSSLHGPSFANHLYTVADDSGGVVGNPYNNGSGHDWGCDEAAGALVDVVNTSGNLSSVFPCFDFTTLADLFQDAGLSWRYYSPAQDEDGYEWNALNAINHVRNSSMWDNIVPYTQFVTDASNGNLPALSWIVTPGTESEHPSLGGSCAGENFAVTQVNAAMQGLEWNSTVIFIVWDDFGGLYDHVPPPVEDQYGLGARVPLLIISPYAISGYLSHTQYEFASFLKFAEERYGLSSLGTRNTNANDMLDSFNFLQAPTAPYVLQTRTCPVDSPASLTFPMQQINTTSAQLHTTIVDYQSAPLTVSNVAVTGDFASTNNCPADGLQTLANCAVFVTFTPTATGVRTGTVTITDNDPSSPQIVTVSGVGTYVTLSTGFNAVLNFGTALVDVPPATQSVTVTNNSASKLTLDSITVTGDFTETNTCGTSILAGASCKITLTFNPSMPGSRYGVLTINDSDAGSPQTVTLTGVGTNVSLSATSLSFGTQGIGSTTTKSVTVTNEGKSELTISSITTTGTPQTAGYGIDFSYPGVGAVYYSQTNNCGTTLAGGASCTISVTFDPNVSGGLNGALNVFYNAADSPAVVTLLGSGS